MSLRAGQRFVQENGQKKRNGCPVEGPYQIKAPPDKILRAHRLIEHEILTLYVVVDVRSDLKHCYLQVFLGLKDSPHGAYGFSYEVRLTSGHSGLHRYLLSGPLWMWTWVLTNKLELVTHCDVTA